MKELLSKYGYSIVETRPVTELEATMVHLRHDKTGLELIWLDRAEENKTFGVAFRTLPEDDTGIFHILEHSVLCGSKKFPVREPFVELLKSSMNTFLNAMTFPDMTFYPISSRNEKDFLNLTEVYLDAVFSPRILSKPEIFMQEGWHYAFDENGNPSYQGVVYGEMKGAFADTEELLDNTARTTLFPNTPYRFVSGGDPAHIPDLSYEQFVDGYHRFYAPSCAYVFLDGKVDLAAVLSLIDEYVSAAEPVAKVGIPARQAPVAVPEQTVEYEVSSQEECEGKDRLALCSVVGNCDEREKMTAIQLLAEVLCGNNHAPLTEAILSRHLAEEVNFELLDGICQPYARLYVKNFRKENRDEIEQVIGDTLRSMVNGGLPHEQLRAVMINMEFKMRERDFGRAPQGLVFGIQVLSNWLHGCDPAAELEVGQLFENLNKKLEQGYFEQLLKEVMLESRHCCKVHLVPSVTCGEALRAAEKARVQKESAAWSKEEKAAMQAAEQRLTAWQGTPDSADALATIPRLTPEDVSAEPEYLPLSAEKENGLSLLRHDLPTGGIAYVTLYFNANDVPEKELPMLSFTAAALGEMGTKKHSPQALMNLRRLLTGDLKASVYVNGFANRKNAANTMLQVSFSAMLRNLPDAVKLVCEILTQTAFDNANTLKNLLTQEKNNCFQHIMMAGSAIGLSRVMAQTDTVGVVNDCASGIAYHAWLSAQEQGDIAQLSEGMTALTEKLAVTSRLTLSATGVEQMKDLTAVLANELPCGTPCGSDSVLSPRGRHREGVVIPADTSFACMGMNLSEAGLSYDGGCDVAAHILSLDYLWNVIRVQGGAYGAGMHTEKTGYAGLYSYRDPHAAQSLDFYQKAPAFLRQFVKDTPDLTGFVIGTLSEAQPLMTSKMKASAADKMYFANETNEERRKYLQQIITANADALNRFADGMEKCAADAGVCVIGGKAQLDACKDLPEIIKL